MKIRVVKTEVTDKGKYKLLKVTFRNLETNKVMSQNCPSFAHPDVFNTLKDTPSDSVFEIKVEKEGDYFNWVQATPSEAPAADAATPAVTGTGRAGTSSGRTWETAEERALRQILIVRQSSMTTANAALLYADRQTIDNLFQLAEKIEAWVFRNLKAADADAPLDVEAAMREILAMKNDPV